MSDLQDKLRRLGVVKGARQLKPAPPLAPVAPSSRPPHPLSQLLPGGRLLTNPLGDCFALDHIYPLGHIHGRAPLAALLDYEPAQAVPFLHSAPLPPSFRDFLFIDTETTGLAGAGSMAFMVGVAFFEEQALVVRQYFLRSPADEPAMLAQLTQLAADKKALISFNGRSFDLPLLDTRYLLTRQPPAASHWLTLPHLDLLHPARRIWRHRFPSCALGALEQNLLGVRRTHEDVPGWFIPTLYANYLRDGHAEPLLRVFYHNQYDMLSMVTLAVCLLRQITTPTPQDDALDLYGLGRWQMDLGLAEAAEQSLRLAADLAPLTHQPLILFDLAALLKRLGRRAEAVPLWEQLATNHTNPDVTPHLELSKYYEWHAADLPQAHHWATRALHHLQATAPYQRPLIAEITHRLTRLGRKL